MHTILEKKNVWNNLKKSSKIGQEQKTLIIVRFLCKKDDVL